ncbi:peptidyl-prolyl isomerase FKBP12 [Saprolegnia diclina VS20]|uniref:peptidylprolyl isomerase n=1 Tax=Saprolegnia diclina (strain VS20) TaxID=1156394 RepID=T0Q5C2_SAPDV|nr:peptidyl-prolyl isomerase FKBP12 [Saprolegnia diclina VS20]EQC28625.1 peptidyl-prolyl isomerase FKBP12 [Saprolegnia diclina VS20]|eukprot:XP_008618022.1 peptidyl-prolyl isomerase FKBP12 [Saprolegnia diclina VS20]
MQGRWQGAIAVVVLAYVAAIAYFYHIETAVNPMGVTKEIIKAGHGPTPTKGATVTVHCTGYGKDRDLSQKFWSTKDAGQQPFTFQVGMGSVIRGWDEGVLGMALGEVARLTCSPDYAYGARGFPAWGIQPDSVLVFEIEVLQIQ